jgi:hypothetical protein
VTARKVVEREQDRILPDDAWFAGMVLVSAGLQDLADQLKVANRRLEQVLEMVEERERRTWKIRVGR